MKMFIPVLVYVSNRITRVGLQVKDELGVTAGSSFGKKKHDLSHLNIYNSEWARKCRAEIKPRKLGYKAMKASF